MTEAADTVVHSPTAARPQDAPVLPLEVEAVKQLVQTLIHEQLKAAIGEQIAAFVQQNEQRAREFSLLERIVRVEEELKALREVQMTQFAASEKRFEAMDKRFEALQREMTARFEAMDKRFEALQHEMTARFEAVDKRFEAVDKRFEAMDKRFEALQREMNARFEAMDKRFEALQHEMTARFEAADKRFEAMDKRFAVMQWTMGLGFTLTIAFMGALKFLG